MELNYILITVIAILLLIIVYLMIPIFTANNIILPESQYDRTIIMTLPASNSPVTLTIPVGVVYTNVTSIPPSATSTSGVISKLA
jgi:hypothetical protein